MAVPVIATELLRSALLNTQSQVKQLLQFDPSELAAEPEGSGGILSEAEQQQALTAARRRNSKEQERLQRIYFFHGHTLGMSALLKNAAHLPNGLPEALVSEVYAYGVELLGQEVLSVPPPVRHVICSVVRAGSLIVASCLSMGYRTALTHLPQLLSACGAIFQVAAAPAASSVSQSNLQHSNSSGSLSGQTAANATNNGSGKGDELVYEVMCVEAALVCISTLLRCCPEALTLAQCGDGYDEDTTHSRDEQGCLRNIVEGLDVAFRAMRGKYQPRLRAHFRFRTLHAILLECFALLPPGSFPQSCAPIFIEVRILQDVFLSLRPYIICFVLFWQFYCSQKLTNSLLRPCACSVQVYLRATKRPCSGTTCPSTSTCCASGRASPLLPTPAPPSKHTNTKRQCRRVC